MTNLPTFIIPDDKIKEQLYAAFFFRELGKLKPFGISAKIAELIFEGGIEPFLQMLRTNKIPYNYNEKMDAYEVDVFLPLTDEVDNNGFLIGRGSAVAPYGIVSPSIQSLLAHDLEQKCRDFVNNEVINSPSNS
jgi:hypothetical protein